MGYSADMLEFQVGVYNRTEAEADKFGIDGAGVEWKLDRILHANITWAKGNSAMRAGALDAYTEILVRMRWNKIVTMRSRIEWNGQMYQIKPETFHPFRREDTIQFNAKLIVNEE